MGKRYFIFLCFAILFISSCKSKTGSAGEDPAPDEVRTPVTITHISTQPITQYEELNAMSSYLQNSFIKATASGYIKSANIKLGEYIKAGQLAFVMQTKEAKALGNTINVLDSSFRFSGLIRISATQTGYITSVDHQVGDYVQDGEQLAILSDAKSFGFLLNLPYELRPYLAGNKEVDIVLPDKRHVKGVVAHVMPSVDSVSQTQAVLIKVDPSYSIPQNLIAKVRIATASKSDVTTLPKDAVLTDESQSDFWVMKMIDSITAVKVPVEKGMETGDKVEIVQPQFSASDKILLSGNYGLPDTAKVKIVKQSE